MMILLLVIVLVVRFIVVFASFGRLNGLSFIHKGLFVYLILPIIGCSRFVIIADSITTTIVTCLFLRITLVAIIS